MAGRIIRLGVPSGLQTSIISLSNVVVQANINSFGELVMAGCGAYGKIDGFVMLPIGSFVLKLEPANPTTFFYRHYRIL